MNNIDEYTNDMIDHFFKKPYQTELSDDECRDEEEMIGEDQEACLEAPYGDRS